MKTRVIAKASAAITNAPTTSIHGCSPRFLDLPGPMTRGADGRAGGGVSAYGSWDGPRCAAAGGTQLPNCGCPACGCPNCGCCCCIDVCTIVRGLIGGWLVGGACSGVPNCGCGCGGGCPNWCCGESGCGCPSW